MRTAPAPTGRVRRRPWARPIGRAPLGEGATGGPALAPDGGAALAVERLARGEVALGAGHRIGAKGAGAAGRLAPQGGGGDRDAELHADQVERPPERGEAPGGVGGHAVLAEAGGGVGVRGLEHHVDAPAQVARDRAAVALEAGDDLDGPRGARGRQEMCARSSAPQGGKARPSSGAARAQALATAAISMADLVPSRNEVNMRRVHAGRRGLVRVEAVVRPDLVRRDGVVGGQVLRPLPRRVHPEAGGARPVDELGDQRRLVAVGHGIDDARRAGSRGKRRAAEGVRLDVHHDHVLARGDGGERVRSTGGGAAGRLDDDVERVEGGELGAAVEDARRSEPGLVPAGGAGGGARPVRDEVGDGGDREPGGGRRLGEEHGAELACADQPDANRAAFGGADCEEHVQVHRDPSSRAREGRRQCPDAAGEKRPR